MAHKPKAKAKKAKTSAPKIEELDLDPDAWPKFEKFLKATGKARARQGGSRDKKDSTKAG